MSEKVSDKDFRNLIKWMYLKQRGNRATFNDYTDFIKRNKVTKKKIFIQILMKC